MNGNKRAVEMVQSQIISRGITDPRVLKSMEKVERHLFVSDDEQLEAYYDEPLKIGFGQTISQPFMVALMTQILELTPESKVLEVGTGSGYQTAILAEIAKKVYSVERIPELSRKAKNLLEILGYNNIMLKIGDGSAGWIEKAPFDRIIVTAGGSQIPKPLVNQLKIDGILVIPVGERIVQTLYQIKKILSVNTEDGYELKINSVEQCIFVPLVGEYA